MFILINIYKNVFEYFVHYLFVQDVKKITDEDMLDPSLEYVNHLEFQVFEIRLFWKISMGGLYFILIIYYCFKKDKTSFKSLKLIFFSISSFIIFFILLVIFQRNCFEVKKFILYLLLLVKKIYEYVR